MTDDYTPRDMNRNSRGEDLYKEYRKYVEECKAVNKEPRSWNDWYFCRYSAFEESWRLSH